MPPNPPPPRSTPTAATQTTPSLFAQAARVFDGWNDAQTGLRVLRIATRQTPVDASGGRTPHSWRTLYHQYPCFLDGGRRVVLRVGQEIAGPRTADSRIMDLTTGEVTNPFPPGYYPMMVSDKTKLAVLCQKDWSACDVVLWDLRARREVGRQPHDGWKWSWCHFTCDGRRTIVARYQGNDEALHHPGRSRLFLLGDDGSSRLLLEDNHAVLNHVQCSPTDPDLFAYDRWPTPYTHVPQVIRIRTIDGSFDEPLKLLPGTLLPGHTLIGGQRDHYVWTPDGTAIASYVTPIESIEGRRDHFEFGWHLSVTNWRTGEDLCAEYPANRWGCHFRVTPDSQWVVSCGGRGFNHLYGVNIQGLRRGWNERILCAYPHTDYDGTNADYFPHPWPLPDQSGVLFTAGWHGPESGVYLAEWPKL